MRQNFTIGCSNRRSISTGFLLSIVSLLRISSKDKTCQPASFSFAKYTLGPSLILPIITPEEELSTKDSIIKFLSDNILDKSLAVVTFETALMIEFFCSLLNLKSGNKFLIESTSNTNAVMTIDIISILKNTRSISLLTFLLTINFLYHIRDSLSRIFYDKPVNIFHIPLIFFLIAKHFVN